MKPTSIIFLIVSIVLVLSGFAVVGVARQMAAAEGIELVSTVSDETGNYVYTYEYDADSIGKITINIRDAKVNIIGGAAKPYVELINFPDGMYEFSSTNRNLNIGNNTDFTSLTGLASLAMNFQGLRSLINYYNIMGLEKEVNVYLSDEHPVNIIDCRLETGAVDIRGCTSDTDYNVEIGTGTLTVNEVATASVVNASVETGDVEIGGCTINRVVIKLGTGSAEVQGECRQVEADIGTGDFEHISTYGIQYYNYKLFTNVGKIHMNGEEMGGYCELTSFPTTDMIDVSIGTGNITLRTE